MPVHSFSGRNPSLVRDALIPISRATSVPSTVPSPACQWLSQALHRLLRSPLARLALLHHRCPAPAPHLTIFLREHPPTPSRKRAPRRRGGATSFTPMDWTLEAQAHRISRASGSVPSHAFCTSSVQFFAPSFLLHPCSMASHRCHCWRLRYGGSHRGEEVLFAGVDLLHYIPIPGLKIATQILLRIWDAV